MPEKIKPELLYFLQPCALPMRILVVESLSYLPKLREMFPAAELLAVADEEDAMEEFPAELGVKFTCLDYLEKRLPYEPESLDYIICDLALERAGNPQDIAAGFSTYLKQTGAFLTSFRNIRYYAIVQELMEGHYYQVVSRLYARPEFERLLYASFYKNVRCAPQLGSHVPEGAIEGLVASGFENEQNDLETEFWLVRADRSMPEMALLKSMYSKEERALFSRIIHRIEYGVEPEASCRAFWELWRELGLFSDYAGHFVREAVFHREQFYSRLRGHTEAGRQDLIMSMEKAGEAEDV